MGKSIEELLNFLHGGSSEEDAPGGIAALQPALEDMLLAAFNKHSVLQQQAGTYEAFLALIST